MTYIYLVYRSNTSWRSPRSPGGGVSLLKSKLFISYGNDLMYFWYMYYRLREGPELLLQYYHDYMLRVT